MSSYSGGRKSRRAANHSQSLDPIHLGQGVEHNSLSSCRLSLASQQCLKNLLHQKRSAPPAPLQPIYWAETLFWRSFETYYNMLVSDWG